MRVSSVHGILQARILEWVAISPSRGFSLTRGEPLSPMSSALAGGFFTIEAIENCKDKNVYFGVKAKVSGRNKHT